MYLHFIFTIGHPKRLEDFQYSDKDIADIISSCLYNISFVGMLGHVKFERSGIPSKNVKLVQIQGNFEHISIISVSCTIS